MGRSQEDFKKGAWTPEVRKNEASTMRCWPAARHRPRSPGPAGTAQEDELLTQLIDEYGAKNWSIIASGITGRSGKSCRLRRAPARTARGWRAGPGGRPPPPRHVPADGATNSTRR